MSNDQKVLGDDIVNLFRHDRQATTALARALDAPSLGGFYATAIGTVARAIDQGFDVSLLTQHANQMLEMVRPVRKPKAGNDE